jgi:hypothetical protein
MEGIPIGGDGNLASNQQDIEHTAIGRAMPVVQRLWKESEGDGEPLQPE